MKSKPRPENSMDRKFVAPSAEAAASRAALAFCARASIGDSTATATMISTLFFINAPIRGSILSRSKRSTDEKSTSCFHARASLRESAKRSSLDGKHRSNTARSPHDSGQGAAAHQCPEVSRKPQHQKLFRERCTYRTERPCPHGIPGRLCGRICHGGLGYGPASPQLLRTRRC